MTWRCSVAVVALLVSGCALEFGDGTRPLTEQQYQIDGIKLLLPEVHEVQDPSTYGQREYKLGLRRHLLMRFETLSKYTSTISVDGTRAFKVTVHLAEDRPAPRLRLCPVTRQWMMHATWHRAIPFGGEGIWTNPGGDYDNSGCVTGVREKASQEMSFDMKDWFIFHVRAKNQNLGLILLADDEVRIVGEWGLTPPRIHFTKWVGAFPM